MTIIKVDFDDVMRFGQAYRGLADSMQAHRSVLKFDTARIQGMLSRHGLHPQGGGVLAGMTLTQAVAEVDADMDRSADYLRDCAATLFRHAGSGDLDQRFDWEDAVLDSWVEATVGIAHNPFSDYALELGADKVLGLLTGLSGIAALGLVPGVPLVGGTLAVIDGLHDLLTDDGGLREQFGDILQILAGGFSVAGAAVLAGFAAGFVTVGTAALGTPLLLAGAVVGLGAVIVSNWDRISDLWGQRDEFIERAGLFLDAATEPLDDLVRLFENVMPFPAPIPWVGERSFDLSGIGLTNEDLMPSWEPLLLPNSPSSRLVWPSLNTIFSTISEAMDRTRYLDEILKVADTGGTGLLKKGFPIVDSLLNGAELGYNYIEYGPGDSRTWEAGVDTAVPIGLELLFGKHASLTWEGARLAGDLIYYGSDELSELLTGYSLDDHLYALTYGREVGMIEDLSQQGLREGDLEATNRAARWAHENVERTRNPFKLAPDVLFAPVRWGIGFLRGD